MATVDPIITILRTRYGKNNIEVKSRQIVIRFDQSARELREKEIKGLKKVFKGSTLKPKPNSVSTLKVNNFTITIKPKKNPITKRGRVNFGPLLSLVKEDKTYKLIPPDDVNEIILMDEFHKLLTPLYNEHGPLTIALGKYIFTNIVGMNANVGTPKSDISLVDIDKKGKLTNSAFISFKKEGGASAFQQYGRLSKKAGDIIFDHALVRKFRDDIVSIQASGFTKSSSGGLERDVYRPVPKTSSGKKLMNLITFGPNFGDRFGEENCHVIAQGKVSFRKMGIPGKYRLLFSDEVVDNGRAFSVAGEYQHVLGARNGSGRNVEGTRGDMARGVRIGIFPRVYRRSWMNNNMVDDGGHRI